MNDDQQQPRGQKTEKDLKQEKEIQIEYQKNWRLIQYNQKILLPAINRYRKRNFNFDIKDQQYNSSQINLQNTKQILKNNLSNHIKILQQKIVSLRTILLNQIKIASLMEKLTSEQQMNINKSLEHIIGLLGQFSQQITIDFQDIKGFIKCPFPINAQQLEYSGSEAVLLESNIFIFSQMENFFQESLMIFNYNNQIQQNENLKFGYCKDIINLMSYTRFQIQQLILTIKAYEKCQIQSRKKEEKEELSVDLFGKKFGKKTIVDQQYQIIQNIIGPVTNTYRNSKESFLQTQNINKALAIAKKFSKTQTKNFN